MDKKDRELVLTALSAALDILKGSPSYPPLNSKTAIVYFDLEFDEDNFNQDKDGPYDHSQLAADFLELGKGNPTKAALKAEDMAVKEISAMLKRVGLSGRLANEGHHDEALVMTLAIDSVGDVKKLVAFIKSNTGGGDDIIYLNAPYMRVGGFQFFPDGTNLDSFRIGGSSGEDLEEWLEEQA